MARKSQLTAQQIKEIKIKRKALRKDLKRRGIKSRAEFEIIAQQMGLSLGRGSKVLMPFWKFFDKYGTWALVGIFLGILATLGIVYGYSVLNRQKEDYTIALSESLSKIGLELSETEDFKNTSIRLTATPVEEVNAMSVKDLPEDLDDAEGEHNGENYLAYTFWVRNSSEKILSYDWQITMLSEEKDISDALWVMVYDEGKQVIYAKAPEGAEAEKLVGYDSWPLYNSALYPDIQYFEKNGKKGVRTTPFVDSRTVCEKTVTGFDVGDVRKYTVVMWVEGDDPECTNSNIGGQVDFIFKFAVHPDDEGVFDDFIYDEDEYYADMVEEESTRDGIIPDLSRD